jgi:hypothetical protein
MCENSNKSNKYKEELLKYLYGERLRLKEELELLKLKQENFKVISNINDKLKPIEYSLPKKFSELKLKENSEEKQINHKILNQMKQDLTSFTEQEIIDWLKKENLYYT